MDLGEGQRGNGRRGSRGRRVNCDQIVKYVENFNKRNTKRKSELLLNKGHSLTPARELISCRFCQQRKLFKHREQGYLLRDEPLLIFKK